MDWDYCPVVREEGEDGAGYGPVQQLLSHLDMAPLPLRTAENSYTIFITIFHHTSRHFASDFTICFV